MNRKLRTVIASLVAVSAAAAIVPMASAAPAPLGGLGEIATLAPADGVTIARPNDGRYSKSAEAKRKAHAQACADLYLMFDFYVNEAVELSELGLTETGNEALDNATKASDSAKQIGCGWAK
jgi:hypothetical protein